MGILKAFASAVRGTMQDQWKEMFYCPSLPNHVLMVRGYKMKSERSANNGSDNIITDGSIIAVADGEAALVISNGKVMSVFMDSGEHIFHSDRTVGVFSEGSFRQKSTTIASDLGRRVAFGGEAPLIHRVYYMNTKHIMGNEIDIPTIPFRAIDSNIGLDMDVTVSIKGCYSMHIVEPLIIYSRIIGNIEENYTTDILVKQLHSEIVSQVNSAFAALARNGMRVSGLPSLAPALGEAIKAAVNPWLHEHCGIEILTFPIAGIKISEGDKSTINKGQMAKVLSDPMMAGGYIAAATGDAMRTVADNIGRGTPASKN